MVECGLNKMNQQHTWKGYMGDLVFHLPSLIGAMKPTLNYLIGWCYLWDHLKCYNGIQCISTSSFDLKTCNVSTRLPSPTMDLYYIGGAVEYNNFIPSM